MTLPFDYSCIRLFIHLSAKNISRSIGQGNISALKMLEDSFFQGNVKQIVVI